MHQSRATTHHHPHNISKAKRGTTAKISANRRIEQTDARLFPAVVKLLDTILQSLTQMRALSIVDDSPDLASAVEARTAFTKGKRWVFSLSCQRLFSSVLPRRHEFLLFSDPRPRGVIHTLFPQIYTLFGFGPFFVPACIFQLYILNMF